MATAQTETATRVPFIIDGADYHPEKTFDYISPMTGKLAYQCGTASLDDAAAAVDSAAEAFKTWRKTTPAERRNIFIKAAEILTAKKEEVAHTMADETGAGMPWAYHNVHLASELIMDMGARISSLEGIAPSLMDPNMSAMVLKEPYGVILSITPWNAPLILGARAIAGPVVAGNTVVLKAPEFAPRTLRILISAFNEAGLPKGVMNLIVHEPASAAVITSALITNPQIRKINFTGSTAVGRIIGKLAGENLKPVVLELGGKSPVIVWDDADLELAAAQCAKGAFLNFGQICMSTERILVHKNIMPQFQKMLSAAVEKMLPSSGPAPVLVNEAAVKRNKAFVADAASKGAGIVHGDINTQEISSTRFRPIILDKVTPEMDIYQKESFGPTVSLYEIETEEEALRIANDTEYGLSSAVFTEDLRRGLRFARAIDAGAVHINSMTVHDEPGLPHGGNKASGFGRFNAATGLDEWVKTKSITFMH